MAGIDYSKWDNLNVDDEEEEAVKKAEAAAAAKPKKKKKKKQGPPGICGNCRSEGARLRCTVCRKAVYCNRECQKSDWRFHKRVCKKPEPKKKDPPPKKKPRTTGDSSGAGAGAGGGSSSGSSKAAAPAPAPSSSSKPAKSKAQPTSAELDAEDEAIIASLKGYRYFHRDVSEQEAKLIGDTTPERLESKAGGGEDDVPQPVQGSKLTNTSAWNTAGTWEERDMTKWAKDRLTALLVGITQDVVDGQAEIKELTDWQGDASIPVIRGKPRFLYDFTFKAKIEVRTAGSDAVKKAQVEIVEFSNDEDDHEMRLTFVAPKPSQLHQAALRSVMEQPNGLLFTQMNGALAQFVTEYTSK